MIGGRRGERAIISSVLWRLQRVQDRYQSFPESDHKRVDALLETIGGGEMIRTPLPVRLDRRDYRLVIA